MTITPATIVVGGRRYAGASQLGQDKWLLETVLHGKREGYFVDIGAADGVKFSNTYLLETQFGWTGLCVEPNDGLFKRLRQQRRCVCEHQCVLDKPGPVDFIQAGYFGGVPEYFSSPFPPEGSRVKKPAVTLEALLQKHDAPRVIHFLSLDTEGSEYAILKNFPFDRYQFLAACVEHNNDPLLRLPLRQLLSRNGYIPHQSVQQERLVDSRVIDAVG